MYRKSTFNRLRVGYNNAYRILFNLPRRTSMSTTLVQNNVPTFHQARRQESVTGGGGGRNKFWGGHEKLIYVNSRGARGHEKFIPVWIKRTRSSVQNFLQILVIVSKFFRFFTNS